MSEEQRTMLAVFTSAFISLTIMGVVALCGGTFRQRCDRAFPHDPARAELCIYNLSHGERP